MTEVTWLANGYRIEHRDRRLTFVAPQGKTMDYRTVNRMLDELAMDDIMPELSSRTRTTLAKHGYTTTLDLKNASMEDISALAGLGRVGLREVMAALEVEG